MVYINKACHNLPTIKPDDGEALNTLALFLVTCSNAVAEMEFLEEKNNVSNMKAIIYKLPYKLDRNGTMICRRSTPEDQSLKTLFISSPLKQRWHCIHCLVS